MVELEKQLKAKLNVLLQQIEISITDQQKNQLVGLVLLLNKWNKAYNLTSVRDPKDMLVKHILDSIVISPYLQGENFIDVGTGPGLPGLPLAIINPNKNFVLLDSLGKRISFIRNTIRELNINNVQVVLSRVEQYKPTNTFDGVLSRAFASLKYMTDWCKHLPSDKGFFYALKGQYKKDEISSLSSNFYIDKVIELKIPELVGKRHLILISSK